MNQYTTLFIQGTGMTIILWLSSSLVSLTFGLLTGTVRSNQLRIPFLSPLLDGLTLLLRGVPLFAQLMIAYFAIPQLFGIAPSAVVTGILTLGFCSGAYASELVRNGYNTIDKGQWLAAQALGYSRWQQVRYIIGPQMLRQIFPSLANEYLMVLKSTALLGAIGIVEITKIGTNVMYQTFNPLPVCCIVAAIYLGLSAVLSGISTWIERSSYAQYN